MVDLKDSPTRSEHVLGVGQKAIRCALRHPGVTGIAFFVVLAMVGVAPFVLGLGMLTGWFGYAAGRTERGKQHHDAMAISNIFLVIRRELHGGYGTSQGCIHLRNCLPSAHIGEIELQVPQLRETLEPFESIWLQAIAKRSKKLLELIPMLYVLVDASEGWRGIRMKPYLDERLREMSADPDSGWEDPDLKKLAA